MEVDDDKLKEAIRGAKTNDKTALGTVYEIVWPVYVRYFNWRQFLYRGWVNYAESEDLADETFLRAESKLGIYVELPDKEAMRWFYRFANFRWKEWYRKFPSLPIPMGKTEDLIPDFLADPFVQFRREFCKEDIQKAIRSLQKNHPPYYEVLVATLIDKKTYEQTAEDLGITVGKVRRRLYEARQYLRAPLQIWRKKENPFEVRARIIKQ